MCLISTLQNIVPIAVANVKEHEIKPNRVNLYSIVGKLFHNLTELIKKER